VVSSLPVRRVRGRVAQRLFGARLAPRPSGARWRTALDKLWTGLSLVRSACSDLREVTALG